MLVYMLKMYTQIMTYLENNGIKELVCKLIYSYITKCDKLVVVIILILYNMIWEPMIRKIYQMIK